MEEWHKENISLYLIQIGDIDHIKTWSSVLHKLVEFVPVLAALNEKSRHKIEKFSLLVLNFWPSLLYILSS